MSRVLFVHVRKQTPEPPMPHLGLASLAAVLRRAGHEAVVFDEVLYDPTDVPPLAAIIARTKPDIIGFSIYTATRDRVLECIRETRASFVGPIMVGGPHATLFPDELAKLSEIDCVVCGEAEDVVVDLVAGAARQAAAKVIVAEAPDVARLPWPDYSATLDVASITFYPIMTSRGCPFQCNFCAVHRIASRRWRPRDPADCVAEISAAAAQFAALRVINVSDDCPTGRVEHLKEFLRLLVAANLGLALEVDNMRADKVDAELVALLKQAGVTSQCIGVESANPEVFALVNKGESLKDIVRAAELIKQGGLALRACFVIGLPGDTLERHRDSVRLARKLKPTQIFWNMAHPFPGTAMYEWFQQHGAEIDEPRTYTSYDYHTLDTPEPTVGTPEFSKWDRRRAHFLAVVETDQYIMDAKAPWLLLQLGWRYRMLGPALRSLARRGLFGSARRLARKLGRKTTAAECAPA